MTYEFMTIDVLAQTREIFPIYFWNLVLSNKKKIFSILLEFLQA